MDQETREYLMRWASERARPDSRRFVERRLAYWDAKGADGQHTDLLINRVTGESLAYYQVRPMRREAERHWHAMQSREAWFRGRRPRMTPDQISRVETSLAEMRRRWAAWVELFEEFGLEVEIEGRSDRRVVLRHEGVSVCAA